MNARFEFGENFLEITNFKHFPQDAVGGSPYNTLFDLRVQSKDGKFTGVGDCEDDIKAITQFADELQEMYDLKRNVVKYRDAFGFGSDVEFILLKNGHITICGTVSAFEHSMEFEFEADQTALPSFIKQLREILKSCA